MPLLEPSRDMAALAAAGIKAATSPSDPSSGKAGVPRADASRLLVGESSRRLNLVIRLQQARFGRFSYHTNLLAGLGRAASG